MPVADSCWSEFCPTNRGTLPSSVIGPELGTAHVIVYNGEINCPLNHARSLFSLTSWHLLSQFRSCRQNVMFPLVVSALLATWSAPQLALALLARHDSSFTPDHILRVTNDNIDIACDQHLSVVINGTTPGPVLRLAPGTSSWIRVYNDVDDQNLTMVCRPSTMRTP